MTIQQFLEAASAIAPKDASIEVQVSLWRFRNLDGQHDQLTCQIYDNESKDRYAGVSPEDVLKAYMTARNGEKIDIVIDPVQEDAYDVNVTENTP